MLAKKCGIVHLRTASQQDEATQGLDIPNKQTSLNEIAQEQIKQLESQPVPQLGPEKEEEQINSYLEKELSDQDGVWPCKQCTKKFVKCHYLLKHIQTKHE